MKGKGARGREAAAAAGKDMAVAPVTLKFEEQRRQFHLRNGRLDLRTVKRVFELTEVEIDNVVEDEDSNTGFSRSTFAPGNEHNVTGIKSGAPSSSAPAAAESWQHRIQKLEEQVKKVDMVDDVQRQIEEMKGAQQGAQAQTTTTYADLGKKYVAAKEVKPLSHFSFKLLPQHADKLLAAYRAVREAFRGCTATGRSFEEVHAAVKKLKADTEGNKKRKAGGQGSVDASNASASTSKAGDAMSTVQCMEVELPDLPADVSLWPEFSLPDLCEAEKVLLSGQFDEEQHMQGPMVRLLQVIADAVGSDSFVEDTHSRSHTFSNPCLQPDAVRFKCKVTLAVCSLIVDLYEWKVGSGERERNTASGQNLTRAQATFAAQPDRIVVPGISITMDNMQMEEYWSIFRQQNLKDTAAPPEPAGELEVKRTDWLPFTIHPDNDAFIMLVSLLATPRHDLGYRDQVPPQVTFNGYQVTEPVLLKYGTRRGCPQSIVYKVKVCKAGDAEPFDAILKLNTDPKEGEYLMRMQNAKHVVQLLAMTECEYRTVKYQALLITPFVQRLVLEDGLVVIVVVSTHVALAILELWFKDLLHRDISHNNFGWLAVDSAPHAKGYLYDIAAAKDLKSKQADSPTKDIHHITGTLAFVPLSLLTGNNTHSIASHLHALFITLVTVATPKGRLHGQPHTCKLDDWATHRRAFFTAETLPDIDPLLRPFLQDLHDLFWPKITGQINGRTVGPWRAPDDHVTVADFLKVCISHHSPIGTLQQLADSVGLTVDQLRVSGR